MRRVVSPNGIMEYFVSGEDPKILIHSGTHGDEFEVTEFVWESLKKYEKELPGFVFVPEVSPTAIAQKTRVNNLGHDMNRVFVTDSTDLEVLANIEIIEDKKFDLFISFHEDPTLDDYYLYDVGYKKGENELVKLHNQKLITLGVSLLTGVDDAEDECLGYDFVEGYRKLMHLKNSTDDGTISSWVLNRHIADEYLLPEIPGKARKEIKRAIVDTFFTDVVLKVFE